MQLFNYLSFIYQDKIAKGNIKYNQMQQQILNAIVDLLNNSILTKPYWWRKILLCFGLSKKTTQQGIYLHGSVGSGKSYLIRLIINNMPHSIRVASWHCNEFIADMTKHIGNNSGHEAITIAIKHFSSRYDMIFIDEFDVHDIANALTIRSVVMGLFNAGVVLLFTSNRAPNDLYLNGLQRESFVPLIQCIQQKCLIFNLSGQDYRKYYQETKNFTFLNDQEKQDSIFNKFQSFTKNYYLDRNEKTMQVGTRKLEGKLIGKAFYTTFSHMCHKALASNDYRKIAGQIDYIFIEGFYKPSLQEKDVLRRMIWLIDELYESEVIMFANFDYDYLQLQDYADEVFEISRMISRLCEMDNKRYNLPNTIKNVNL